MDQSALSNPAGPVPTPTTEPSSSSSAVRTGTESGWITPEEVSNITSSDAATVHSSDSGILIVLLIKRAKGSPVAEWFRMLIFSALNRSSSHRCGFEPSSGHVRGQILLVADQMFFLRDLPFLPHLNSDSALNE